MRFCLGSGPGWQRIFASWREALRRAPRWLRRRSLRRRHPRWRPSRAAI